ncbi:MAG: hypothetical protein ACHQET_06095 [Chitinophagales bacterium]
MNLKKSKKIQLVLISAALASCHREFIPSGSIPVSDYALTEAPVYDEEVNPIYMPCFQGQQSLWRYSFNPTGYYYAAPAGQGYYPSGYKYRKAIIWRGNKLILRGGWGKTAGSSTAS